MLTTSLQQFQADLSAELADLARFRLPQLRLWSAEVAQAAAETMPTRRFGWLLVGVGERESHWATGPGYSPQHSWAGWGDRAHRQYTAEHLARCGSLVENLGPVLGPGGAQATDRHGAPLFWAAVAGTDSTGRPRGWGHSPLQLDAGAHPELLLRKLPDGRLAWTDPLECSRMAARILLECVQAFPNDEKAALASYNAGVGGAQRGLQASGDPDQFTTGGDYGAWIQAQLAQLGAPA